MRTRILSSPSERTGIHPSPARASPRLSGLRIDDRGAHARGGAHYAAEIAARRWHKVYIAEIAVPVERARELVGEHKAYLATEGRRAPARPRRRQALVLSIVHAAPATRTACSHVLVRLHTGRFHQIRVMLSALGAPLVGDTRYCGPTSGPMYLEHVILGARPFGGPAVRVWRAPDDVPRPAWSSSLREAVAAEVTRISEA